MARQPAFVFSTQPDSGHFKLSPISKLGAGWETPALRFRARHPGRFGVFHAVPSQSFAYDQTLPPMPIFRVR